MTDIVRAITLVLAAVGGTTLCVLFWMFAINLHALFERVDHLEEVVSKHGQAIRRMKDAAD